MIACVLIDPIVYYRINMYIFKYSNRAFINLNEKHIYYELENVVTFNNFVRAKEMNFVTLQRWAIIYVCMILSLEHSNVDALSRLPLRVNHIPAIDLDIHDWIIYLLSKVYGYVQKGWPHEIAEEQRPYQRCYRVVN